MPVSGATKRAWSQASFEEEGGYNLFQNFRDVLQIPAFDYELLTALAICAGFLLALVWWLSRRSRSREDWLLLAFMVGVFSLAVWHLAKFVQTVLTVDPGWGVDYWYYVPAYLMLGLTIPVGCCVVIHFLRRLIGPRSALAANAASGVIVFVGAVFLFTEADFTGPFRYVDERSQSTHREREVTIYMGMQVVNAALPEDSVLGSWDAGAIGYFSAFPVVNLDGLVNSYAYFHAQQGGTETEFYPRYGITHFANISNRNVGQSEDAILFEGPPFFHDVKGELRFRLWPVEPTEDVDRAAWFWQRMEPYLDYRADGVGLLVDGRAAQAFARDCAPGEFIVWEWGGGPTTGAQPWTQTQTGLCTAATVLPHGATSPVQGKRMTASDYLVDLVGDRQPAISGDFDVYPIENQLLYVREQCAPYDTATWFFLHLEPVEVKDLPEQRQQYGFDNLDFRFDQYGNRFGALCWAVVPLPEYGIAAFRTGQYAPVKSSFSDYLADLVGDHQPAISADFDVYLVENRLIYATEQCDGADLEAWFFLALYPVDVADLPGPSQQYGFDNRDFTFDRQGDRFGDFCWAVVPLPEYAISRISTGQYVPVEGGYHHLWEGEFLWQEGE